MNRTPTGLPAGFMKVGIRVKNGLKLQKENVNIMRRKQKK